MPNHAIVALTAPANPAPDNRPQRLFPRVTLQPRPRASSHGCCCCTSVKIKSPMLRAYKTLKYSDQLTRGKSNSEPYVLWRVTAYRTMYSPLLLPPTSGSIVYFQFGTVFYFQCLRYVYGIKRCRYNSVQCDRYVIAS